MTTGSNTRPTPSPAAGPPTRLGPSALAVLVGLTALGLLLGYTNKARCVGPEFDTLGRSGPDYEVRHDRDLCYSDIQHLWLGRDIDRHVFPYLHGGLTPEGQLVGGSVEYPVLTGLLIWAGALLVSTDGGFLLGTALVMAPFGLLTGWVLGRLARWRALVWALGPPLVLYAFHNWDLPAVACTVAAVGVMHLAPTRYQRWSRVSTARRGYLAAALLGLGSAFKLYPGAFVAPLALYVLTAATPGRRDWRAALRTVVAALAVVVAVNLPFALLGYPGWRASFAFQAGRAVDITTNSVWYWGFRPLSDPDNVIFQAWVDRVSPTLVLISFAVALVVGWGRYRRTGYYPWVAVSAAMLCGFLLLHKVHSPQYTLWLLPYFVLLRVRWEWVASYLVADLAMGLGIFRYFYHAFRIGQDFEIYSGLAAQAVMVGVWGRAALLVALFAVFLQAEPTFGCGGPHPVPSRPDPPGRQTSPIGPPPGGGPGREVGVARSSVGQSGSSAPSIRTGSVLGNSTERTTSTTSTTSTASRSIAATRNQSAGNPLWSVPR